MEFKIPDDKVKVEIKSTNRDLNGRFSIFNVKNDSFNDEINRIASNGGKEKFNHFRVSSKRPYSRTKIYLGFDEILNRPVIIKTPRYRTTEYGFIVSDYDSEEYIERRREIIRAQIDILNDVQSPLLPEPIDFFEVENTEPRIPKNLRKNDPVLILDYQSSTTLQQYIESRIRLNNINQEEVNESNNNDRGRQSRIVREKLRIIKDIVIFLKELDAKGYTYQGLNPKSILVLRDKTPRFIGLGYICKSINGVLDSNHINFRSCELGYAAPELKNLNLDPNNINARAVATFSIGVLIHQLIGEYKSISTDIIGEYGHFKYPNGITDDSIKTGPLKGNHIHNLISKLCKENPKDRMTNFDDILNEIEIIIGSSKQSSVIKTGVKHDKYVPGVLMTYLDTHIKHCEDDNEILYKATLGIGFYCRSKDRSLGFLNHEGYLCKKCGKAYIDEEVYEDIEEKLQSIIEEENNTYNLKLDEHGNREKVYINIKDNIINLKRVNRILVVSKPVYKCEFDDEFVEMQEVMVPYYKKGNIGNDIIGFIKYKLPVCKNDSCKNVYLPKSKVDELIDLLPDKEVYSFNISDYEQDIKVAVEIRKMDNIKYCSKDLEKLNLDTVRVPYYGSDKSLVGYVTMKLLQCPKCKIHYITDTQKNELNARLPKGTSARLYNKPRRVEDIFKVNDISTCPNDKNKLQRVRARTIAYSTSKNKQAYQIQTDVYYCKDCKNYYINEKEYNRLLKIIPKDYKINKLKDYENKDDSNGLIIVDNVIKGENMILCLEDKKLLNTYNVKIALYDSKTNKKTGYITMRAKCCSNCKKVYLSSSQIRDIENSYLGKYIKVVQVKSELNINYKDIAKEVIGGINKFIKNLFK